MRKAPVRVSGVRLTRVRCDGAEQHAERDDAAPGLGRAENVRVGVGGGVHCAQLAVAAVEERAFSHAFRRTPATAKSAIDTGPKAMSPVIARGT